MYLIFPFYKSSSSSSFLLPKKKNKSKNCSHHIFAETGFRKGRKKDEARRGKRGITYVANRVEPNPLARPLSAIREWEIQFTSSLLQLSYLIVRKYKTWSEPRSCIFQNQPPHAELETRRRNRKHHLPEM